MVARQSAARLTSGFSSGGGESPPGKVGGMAFIKTNRPHSSPDHIAEFHSGGPGYGGGAHDYGDILEPDEVWAEHEGMAENSPELSPYPRVAVGPLGIIRVY